MKTIQTALLISALSFLTGSGYSNTFTLVSLSGDEAETTTPQAFDSFSIPSINEAGQVAFGARFDNPEIDSVFLDSIEPVFQANCISCHGQGGVAQQRFDLTEIQNSKDLLLRPQRIQTIINRVNSTGNNVMPPRAEPPLDQEVKVTLTASLSSLLAEASKSAELMDAALQFDNGQLHTLGALGETVDINGETGQFESIRSVTSLGGADVAFIATLTNHSISATDLLLTANGDSQSPQLHTHGLNAPLVDFDGTLDSSRRHEIFGSLAGSTANAYAFWSRLRMGQNPDESGIWLVDLNSVQAPLYGQRLLAIGGQSPDGGTQVLESPISSSLNASGEAALLSTIEDSDENDFNNPQGIWKLDANSMATSVAQTGEVAPGSSDVFLSLGRPEIDASGNIVFWASLLNDNEEEGLYHFDGSTLAALATSETAIDIFETNRTFTGFMDPVVNGDGDIAVLATEFEGSLQTILHRSSNGDWSIIAQSEMQSPGADHGVSFQTFSMPRINGAGQIAFQATLSGEGDAISDTTDSGIWATDSNGALSLVAREGDTFEVKEGFPATVESTSIGGFNATGQLALNYSFTNGAEAIGIVQVEDVPPPAITSQPNGTTSFDGESFALSVEASGQGPFEYQWNKDGVAIEGATSSALEFSDVSDQDNGNYTVTITSPTGSTTSNVASISIQSLPDAPVFVDHPLGDVALKGTQAILDARAVSNTTVTYQWYQDGAAVEGATGSALSINPADNIHEGTYHVVATSGGGAATSDSAEILVTDKRLYNIATRARVGTGANVLIAGFVVIGPDPKEILVRGIGPSLIENGIDDPLLKPRLEIYNSASELIYSNEGWAENEDPDAIIAASQLVGAGGRNLHDDDTALLVELEQGLYTAIVRGQDNSTGVALVEAFEIEENFTRMINLSSRALVGTGADVVIPGFVVQGDLPSRVLIRAVGPSLENQGVAGFLANPQITVYDIAGTPIESNDGWLNLWDPSQITEASQLVGAFPLNEDSEDAAIIMDLEPGLYTVIASGENGTTGVALVELYAIP